MMQGSEQRLKVSASVENRGYGQSSSLDIGTGEKRFKIGAKNENRGGNLDQIVQIGIT